MLDSRTHSPRANELSIKTLCFVAVSTSVLLLSNVVFAATSEDPAESADIVDSPSTTVAANPGSIGRIGTSARFAIGSTGRTSKSAIGGTGRTSKSAIGGTGRTSKSAIGGTARTPESVAVSARSPEKLAPLNSLNSNSSELPLLRGRIDELSSGSDVVGVLGQRFAVEKIEDLTLGAVIVIEGYIAADGGIKVHSSWVDEQTPYIDGSSEVVVTGKVTSVDASLGKLKIGSLVVDYNATLWNNSEAPTVGSIFKVRGIRPTSNGEFLAFEALSD